MPPRRSTTTAAAAAQPTSTVLLPLDGCCIAFSGTFRGISQVSLQKRAIDLGAEAAKSITPNVTHLVTTQADYDKPSTKVTQALDAGASVVGLDWMTQSEAARSRQPESNFALDSRDCKAVSTSSTNNPKKRSASPIPGPESKKSKLLCADGNLPSIGKSQIAKDWSIQIPLDEGCFHHGLTGYGVHVDDDSIIWDAALNQTNAGRNNNKFYRLQLLVGPNNHCVAWTRWGRVGDSGQKKILGNGSLADAKMNFEKKFREKSGLHWQNRMDTPKPGKYVFLERNYESDDDEDDAESEQRNAGTAAAEERKPPPCTLEPPVQRLMELIFNQQYFAAAMSDLNYDDKKMPLGKLSKATIMRGFQTLKDLSALLDNPSSGNGSTLEGLSNMFYSLIPHVFGRARPPVINNHAMVKREIELLENLADLKDATNIMKKEIDEANRIHPLDRQFRGLGLKEMTNLDPNSSEYRLLEWYLMDTRAQTHSAQYTVEDIFRIERCGEQDRFDVFAGPIRDRRLLWHGSRATNFGGILSQGLRIAPPEAPASGYMFGKGVYLADMSSKSANYCCSYISGGTALLLLCEAELGTPMQKLTSFNYSAGEDAKTMGALSTFGMGGTGPLAWRDAGIVHPSLKGVMMPATERKLPGRSGVSSTLLYNEYICYDVAQVRLRYLFRVKM